MPYSFLGEGVKRSVQTCKIGILSIKTENLQSMVVIRVQAARVVGKKIVGRRGGACVE